MGFVVVSLTIENSRLTAAKKQEARMSRALERENLVKQLLKKGKLDDIESVGKRRTCQTAAKKTRADDCD